MNYPESKKILEKIKKAKRILLNCHYSPDPDSVGSALSMAQVLKSMGKKISVYSPTQVAENLSFLPGFDQIKVADFNSLNFSDYDLFIVLDSSTWGQAVGNKSFVQPKELTVIVIDHHSGNSGYGQLNLIDAKSVAVCEILFRIFEDWNLKIDTNLATTILTGIIGDSGAFRFPATTTETLRIASELVKKGADKNEIIFNLFQGTNLATFRLWGLALSRLKVENRFAWTAINYHDYKKFGESSKAKSAFATAFLSNVDQTDFGLIIVEEKPEFFDISLRSRTGFDTSKIAMALGGGGHVHSSGARIEGLSFDQAVEKVLETARKYAQKAQRKS